MKEKLPNLELPIQIEDLLQQPRFLLEKHPTQLVDKETALQQWLSDQGNPQTKAFYFWIWQHHIHNQQLKDTFYHATASDSFDQILDSQKIWIILTQNEQANITCNFYPGFHTSTQPPNERTKQVLSTRLASNKSIKTLALQLAKNTLNPDCPFEIRQRFAPLEIPIITEIHNALAEKDNSLLHLVKPYQEELSRLAAEAIETQAYYRVLLTIFCGSLGISNFEAYHPELLGRLLNQAACQNKTGSHAMISLLDGKEHTLVEIPPLLDKIKQLLSPEILHPIYLNRYSDIQRIVTQHFFNYQQIAKKDLWAWFLWPNDYRLGRLLRFLHLTPQQSREFSDQIKALFNQIFLREKNQLSPNVQAALSLEPNTANDNFIIFPTGTTFRESSSDRNLVVVEKYI